MNFNIIALFIAPFNLIINSTRSPLDCKALLSEKAINTMFARSFDLTVKSPPLCFNVVARV